MLGARLGHGFGGKGSVTLWYDYLSGDGDLGDDTIKVFDTLFATNHKFYGFADLFLNIPVHTGGRGLQDLAIKGAYRVNPEWTLKLDLHSFNMADKGSLTSGHFGEEIDVGSELEVQQVPEPERRLCLRVPERRVGGDRPSQRRT